MKKINKSNILLIFILLLASFLRLYNLSSIPISLNPDELAIGYNAYSILTTGIGEWGETFPYLALRSFGDWKLPVYQLLSIPFISIFSLNEFSVRILSALSGIFSVFLIYKITHFIFKNKNISLFASLFMAISPWMIFFSRGAFEPNLAVALYLLGLVLFYCYTYGKAKSYFYIGLSALFFGLTLFTYHPFLVFTPLFLLTLLIFYRKYLNRKSIIIGAVVFSIFVILTAYSLYTGSGQKLASVGVFGNENIIYNRVYVYRVDNVSNLTFSKILYNKFTITPYHISQNYLLTFSPSFIFDGKTTKLFYGIGGFGYFYLIDVLFIVFGVFGLIYKRDKNMYFLFTWILISPIPSAITSEAPSVSRLIQIVPPIVILSSYGLFYLISILRKIQFYKIGIIFISLLVVINFLYFVDQYYNHMNYYRAKFFHYGYKEAVSISNKYPDKNVVMVGPDNFPYISYLFYNKYDSNKFRNEVVKYEPEKNGFVYVKSFGKYNFVKKLNRDKLEENTIYFDYPRRRE